MRLSNSSLWILLSISCVKGLDLTSIKQCCSAGSNHSTSGFNCEHLKTPILDLKEEDELKCLESAEVCCKTKERETQCETGKQDAEHGKVCTSTGSSDTRKSCCEACKMGIEIAQGDETCQDFLKLGKIFVICCKGALKTTTASTQSVTVNKQATQILSKRNTHNEVSSTQTTLPEFRTPIPPLENLCDIEGICAQICIPIGDSYKCDCNKGFSLMADNKSCKSDKKTTDRKQQRINRVDHKNQKKCEAILSHDSEKVVDVVQMHKDAQWSREIIRELLRSKGQRCEISNPCDHECVDTGVAIKCKCRDGYELTNDKRTCKDIDECATNTFECEPYETCLNDDGGYFCEDPNSFDDSSEFTKSCDPGYKFNGQNRTCDDIDECVIGLMCPRPKTCYNTIGSFRCEDEKTIQCPPGFQYNSSAEDCSDVDECVTEENHCNKESQVCLNTRGNYTCIDKVSKRTCPPGFKKNPINNICEDIDECEENVELCGTTEICLNEIGGHTCLPKTPKIQDNLNYPTNRYPTRTTSVYPTDITRSHTPAYIQTTQTSRYGQNTPSTTTLSPVTNTTLFATSIPDYRTTARTTFQVPSKPSIPPAATTTVFNSQPATSITYNRCGKGYRYFPEGNGCVDIDECGTEQPCDSNQECQNTLGSYKCECKAGFTSDYITGACIDVNECQIGIHDCTDTQRCDNTLGSYYCARLAGCGTGYTLNMANGLCEDDDECALGTHNCGGLGSAYKCRNTLGSYRCDPIRIHRYTTPTTQTTPSRIYPDPPIFSGQRKKCLPGYIMNYEGNCEDIDECESSPCKRGETCLNLNGRYQCNPRIQCRAGYELNDAADLCVDVNECSRNTHKCNPTQICRNGGGYYTCECPPGHHLNPKTNLCEDIDECKFYRVCYINANCINTIGSYKCECKEGFRSAEGICQDIDECAETNKLCDHTCVNIWGSYRCACQPGFILNHDNRTCTDVDECEKFKDKKLCIGNCLNVQGSYTCTCPKGYRLGIDGRTCQDIDECERNVCPNYDDICVNTRGGYKCYPINCPSNYIRDVQHKSRCKRPQTLCDARDTRCILMPAQYTYHFVAIVSDLPIVKEGLNFFQIRGPNFYGSKAEFTFRIRHVNCPAGTPRINEYYFRVDRDISNAMRLYLLQSITGPQEAELEIEMKLFDNNRIVETMISRIFIIISQYTF